MMRTLVMVAAGVSLLGCATPQPYPTLETAGPQIEVGSLAFTGVDGNLYAALAGATELVRLTDGASASTPELSYSGYVWADGELVYTTQEATADGAVSASMYAVRPGERSRLLYTQDGLAPFFLNASPDGARVGYLGSEAGRPGFVMGSVELATGATVVHGRGQPFYAAWAPGGNALLTHVGLPGSEGGSLLALQRADASGTLERPRPLDLATGPFQTPDYAPDGSRIAVVLSEGDSAGIHILDERGDDLGRLVGLQGSAASLAWSPAGNRIAYLDGITTQIGALVGRLFVVRFGADRPRLVSEAAIAHFWSPDGTKLLYFEPVVLGSAQGETLGYRVGMYSLLSGDSQVLATMLPARAFAQQIIPFVDQYERTATIWSSDSRLVALNSRSVTGQPVIHLVDTETLRAGDTFRVSFTPAQAAPSGELGLLPAEGVETRALAFGSIPFFARGR
ncbi:MAG: hypothetical protein ACOC1U_07210 [Spirochaetota bacterium]